MATRGRTFNAKAYVHRANGIASWWNRYWAGKKGSSDGAHAIYGHGPFDKSFEAGCSWLQQQEEEANRICSSAENDVQNWQREIERKRDECLRRVTNADKQVSDYLSGSLLSTGKEVYCSRPTGSSSWRIPFLVVMFITEFLITFGTLKDAGGNTTTASQLGIAFATALALTWVADLSGERVRKRPLKPSASDADRHHHRNEIIILSSAILIILGIVTIVRARALQASPATDIDGANAANSMVQWAFLAVGIGLVLVAVYKGHSHEYSGAKYGMAEQEREREKALEEKAVHESQLARISDYRSTLRRITDSNVRKLFSAYSAGYRKSVKYVDRVGAP